MTTRNDTQRLVLCGLFAALTAVLSQVAIPLPMVPINMALVAVYLAGGVLGARWGMISMVVYVCLGAVGLPVFSLFRGGVGILVGPTGGYIVGYVLTAGLVGWLSAGKAPGFWQLASYMAVGVALCYVLGTAWFVWLTSNTVVSALGLCVLPFLPGDVVKIALAAVLVPRLRRLLR